MPEPKDSAPLVGVRHGQHEHAARNSHNYRGDPCPPEAYPGTPEHHRERPAKSITAGSLGGEPFRRLGRLLDEDPRADDIAARREHTVDQALEHHENGLALRAEGREEDPVGVRADMRQDRGLRAGPALGVDHERTHAVVREQGGRDVHLLQRLRIQVVPRELFRRRAVLGTAGRFPAPASDERVGVCPGPTGGCS